MKRRLAIITLLFVVYAVTVPAQAQRGARKTERTAATRRVLAIGNLTYTEIDALNRDRTHFLLPAGMLEEHGPHLPIASDQFGVEYEVGQVVESTEPSTA